jgi:Mor family transcriptional regulator
LLEHFGDDYSDMVDLARRVGPDVMDVVLEVLGGQKVHVPYRAAFWSRLERELRDAAIRQRFRGNNHVELALAYGLSPRQIARIVTARKNSDTVRTTPPPARGSLPK